MGALKHPIIVKTLTQDLAETPLFAPRRNSLIKSRQSIIVPRKEVDVTKDFQKLEKNGVLIMRQRKNTTKKEV
jgi:hypothetical protein